MIMRFNTEIVVKHSCHVNSLVNPFIGQVMTKGRGKSSTIFQQNVEVRM